MNRPVLWLWHGLIGLIALAFIVQLAWVDHLAIGALPLNYPWTGLAILSVALLIEHRRRVLSQGKLWPDTPAVFLTSLIAFLSTFRWHGSDNFSTSLLPFCLIQHGSLYLNPFESLFSADNRWLLFQGREGYVSFYPILGGLLGVPVYLLAGLRGVVPNDHVLHQLEKITASLLCAGGAALWFGIFRRKLQPQWSAALAILWALGTLVFPLASQALWQHGPSCVMLVAALYALNKAENHRTAWSAVGFFAVGAISGRTPDFIFAIALGVLSLVQAGWRGGLRYALGALFPSIALLSYWRFFVGTGLPAEFSVQTGFFSFPPPWEGFVGFLLSPSRGLLWLTPLVVFAVWGCGIALRSKDGWERRNAMVVGASVAVSYMFFSCYGPWMGGFSFGPRYLLEAVTVSWFFLPYVVPRLQASRMLFKVFVVFGVFSVVCHAVGAYGRWPWEDVVANKGLWKLRSHPLIYQLSKPFVSH